MTNTKFTLLPSQERFKGGSESSRRQINDQFAIARPVAVLLVFPQLPLHVALANRFLSYMGSRRVGGREGSGVFAWGDGDDRPE